MSLESLIPAARQEGASDLHLEPGLAPALRIRGSLRLAGRNLPVFVDGKNAVGDGIEYNVGRVFLIGIALHNSAILSIYTQYTQRLQKCKGISNMQLLEGVIALKCGGYEKLSLLSC